MNGYIIFLSDNSLQHPLVTGLIDSYGDGLVDVDEPQEVVVEPPVPQLQPVQPLDEEDTLEDAEVLTGLQGIGCSVSPMSKAGSVDSTLTTFMGLSMFMMAWRIRPINYLTVYDGLFDKYWFK